MTNEDKILALLEKQDAAMDRVCDELRNINITLENQVFPQLTALSEG